MRRRRRQTQKSEVADRASSESCCGGTCLGCPWSPERKKGEKTKETKQGRSGGDAAQAQ